LPASEPARNGSQPNKLPPAPLPYWTGAFDDAGQRRRPGLEDGRETADDVGRSQDLHQLQKALGTLVWATDRAVSAEEGVPLA
jgi:hypothetical protein